MQRDFTALAAYLAERQTMAFAWGSRANDCVSFYAGAARAMAGFDPIAGLNWTTERGAARVIGRMGGMAAAVSSRMTPVAPAMAMRGDAAGVHDDRFGLLIMLVEGEWLVGPGNGRRLMRAPRSAMLRAWTFGGAA